MGLFSKKPSRDDLIAQGQAAQIAEAEAAAAGEKKEEAASTGNQKIDLELVKIKAQLESFGEIRKANSERFSRIGEQMGELRGMIMDTNKTISKIEVSATKAIDLVESVQPEKLMIELRKMDGKVEGLRANIESNESMMKDLMEELKKMRTQMNFYKGIEQVAKLNDEVKGEILEIKKIEATIERHADKGETIFLDMEKKFSAYEKFTAQVKDMEDTFHAIQNDFDKTKLDMSNKAEKKEFLKLMDKFSEFEKHTSEVLKLLDERNKQSKQDIKDSLKKMKKVVAKKHGLTLEDLEDTGSRERELPDIKLAPQIQQKPAEPEPPLQPVSAPPTVEATKDAPKQEEKPATPAEPPKEQPAQKKAPPIESQALAQPAESASAPVEPAKSEEKVEEAAANTSATPATPPTPELMPSTPPPAAEEISPPTQPPATESASNNEEPLPEAPKPDSNITKIKKSLLSLVGKK